MSDPTNPAAMSLIVAPAVLTNASSLLGAYFARRAKTPAGP
jgi:hypothetical protein